MALKQIPLATQQEISAINSRLNTISDYVDDVDAKVFIANTYTIDIHREADLITNGNPACRVVGTTFFNTTNGEYENNPKGYYIKRYGLIVSRSQTIKGEAISPSGLNKYLMKEYADGSEIIDVGSNTKNNNTQDVHMYSNLPPSSVNDYVSARAYADIADADGNVYTIYSTALMMKYGDGLGGTLKVEKQIETDIPFRFGITEDGQYGYYKDGADTVTPFKHPKGTLEISENGSYNVSDYETAEVNVSGGDRFQTKSVGNILDIPIINITPTIIETNRFSTTAYIE